MIRLIFAVWVLAAALILATQPTYATVTDSMVSQARQCTKHFARLERVHGIPVHLLGAIANTETGRYHKGMGMNVPWPWTINAEGKGYFFDSKSEAIAKVRSLQAKGMKSIDIGCMQVNLKHHPKAFASLDQAFDPYYNVSYAAKFLRRNYESEKSWAKAAAAYHSKTPKFGNRYLKKIEKAWADIVGKVRNARISQWESPYKVASRNSTYSAPPRRSVKSITVSDAPSKGANDVLVIRPKTQATPKAPAQPQETGLIEVKPARSETKVIQVSHNSGNGARTRRQPVFVFE